MTTTLSQLFPDVFVVGVEIVAKVTLLLLLAWLASTALRRASAAVRHLLATVVILFVLAMPGLIRLSPQWRVPILPIEPVAQKPPATQTETLLFSIQPIKNAPNVTARLSRPARRWMTASWTWW